MRRYSTNREDKVYITNSWCVSGEQIQLQQSFGAPGRYKNKNIRINCQEQEELFEDRTPDRKTEKGDRGTIKLNITDYKNLQVCNKQLRHIYETVEVKDFERILNNIYISSAVKKVANNREDKILKKFEEEAEEIFEEFFGQYYNYLRDVINSKSTN